VSTSAQTSLAPWSAVVGPADEALYERAGFARSGGLGTRVALLVIDVQYRTVGHTRAPIETAMSEYPTACGERGWSAVDRIERLLAAARERDVAVFFPHVAPKTAATSGRFRAKSPTLASRDAAAYAFVAQAAPRGDEVTIPKDHPSAFFATALISQLVERGIDTLLLAGATTSGCVRATAVDAFSYGFRVGIVADAVYDRTDVAHQASLFDLNAKYGDVIDAATAIAHLDTLPAR
jgi:maleamate amidohydrolase